MSLKKVSPLSASNIISPPESIVIVVPERSIVPSAVIPIFASPASVSVVTISNVPLVPTVSVTVSSVDPVMVITFPLNTISSTVNCSMLEFPVDVIAPQPIVPILDKFPPVIVAVPSVMDVPCICPVDVIAPLSTVPANTTFAPVNVAAVVVPDLRIIFPELFVTDP